MKKLILTVSIIVIMLILTAWSQNPGTMRERLENVEQRLNNLEKRIYYLEKIIPTAQAENTKSDLEETVEGMLARGSILSINTEHNQIRVDTDRWNALTVMEKKALVLMFSDYMFLKTANKNILILKDDTSESLARYSPEISNDIILNSPN